MQRTRAGESLPGSDDAPWRTLLRLRWLLGGVVALAFAAGQVLEALLLHTTGQRLWWDVVAWGLLGGLATWVSLTWAARQREGHQRALRRALEDQQALNRALQRSNSHLALLSDVNRCIAASSSLDEILDAALAFPQKLVPARAATVVLNDPDGPVETRTDGVSPEDLAGLRATLGITAATASGPRSVRLHADQKGPGGLDSCLLLPLHDGLASVGWVEMYLDRTAQVQPDEMELLETVGSEIAEAIMSSRRRSREERAVYELERGIAEERARIARDIHDGTAQSLAFVRMRVDLWLEWIDNEPERLRGELVDLKASLREQIAELRRAIFALRPVQFDSLGFAGGLQRYIVEFAGQQGWDVHVDLSAVPPHLPPDLEAVCFRVVQEALTNAAKHAEATRVDVDLEEVDGGLLVRVRDNGKGFTPGAAGEHPTEDRHAHLGLRQMRERLAALRGQLTLLSQPGMGTELHAWLPLDGRDRAPAAGERSVGDGTVTHAAG